jgi:2-hydroxychromene-2-carboxylate isomerase
MISEHPMPRQIDFCFDFVGPCSYLATEAVKADQGAGDG